MDSVVVRTLRAVLLCLLMVACIHPGALAQATLASVTVTPSPLATGGHGVGTVTLSAPASSPIQVAVTTSNKLIASISGSPFTIPIGSIKGTFKVTGVLAGNGCVITATASIGGSSQSVQTTLNVVPNGALAAVSIRPNRISRGAVGAGVVTLAAPASSTVVVNLTTSNNQTATLSVGQVIIYKGKRTGTFSASAMNPGACTITAADTTPGYTQSTQTTLDVVPNGTLASVNVMSNPLPSGALGTGVVTLAAPASGPVVVDIATSNNQTAAVLASPFTIPIGKSTGKFTLKGLQPGTSCLISASTMTTGVLQTVQVVINVTLEGSPDLAASPWPKYQANAQNAGGGLGYGAVGAPVWSVSGIYGNDSSPVIGSDGTIYMASYGGGLYALNPNGTQKWVLPLTVLGTPVIGAGGTLYVNSTDGYLHAIAPNGTQEWAVATGQGSGSLGPNGTNYGSPAIGPDGTIYVAGNLQGITSYANAVGILCAVSPTGFVKWTWTTPNGYQLADAPPIGQDGTIYLVCIYAQIVDVGGPSSGVFAISPSGAQTWFCPTMTGSKGACVGLDGTIYLGTWGEVVAVSPNGTLKWQYQFDTSQGFTWTSTPSVGWDGTIYFCTVYPANLYALTPNGQLKWVFPLNGESEEAPTLGADGTIYVGAWHNGGGNLYAVNPDGSQLWMLAGGQALTPVAINTNGMLYVDFGSFSAYK